MWWSSLVILAPLPKAGYTPTSQHFRELCPTGGQPHVGMKGEGKEEEESSQLLQ